MTKRKCTLPIMIIGFVILPWSARSQVQANRPAPSAVAVQPPINVVVLTDADVRRIQDILPELVSASRKGPAETKIFLARQELSFSEITKRLSAMSVAYSSMKFEEYMKELQPQLEGHPGEYQKLVEDSRKQLEEITAPFRALQRNGRTALDLNREVVARNLAAVEQVIGEVREVVVPSLPRP